MTKKLVTLSKLTIVSYWSSRMTIFDNTANFDQKILTGSGVSTSGCGLKQSRQFPITSNCKWLHVKSTTYSFYTYFTFDLFSVRKWKGVACIGRPPTLRRVCTHKVSLFLSRSKIFIMTSHADRAQCRAIAGKCQKMSRSANYQLFHKVTCSIAIQIQRNSAWSFLCFFFFDERGIAESVVN